MDIHALRSMFAKVFMKRCKICNNLMIYETQSSKFWCTCCNTCVTFEEASDNNK